MFYKMYKQHRAGQSLKNYLEEKLAPKCEMLGEDLKVTKTEKHGFLNDLRNVVSGQSPTIKR